MTEPSIGSAEMGDVHRLAYQTAETPAVGAEPKKDCKCPARKIPGLTRRMRFAHAYPTGLGWGDSSRWDGGWIPLRGEAAVGHSWWDLGDGRSYGWYPDPKASTADILKGHPGKVNGGAAQDPHGADKYATMEWEAWTKDGDCRTDEEIKNCIESYFKAREAQGGSYGAWGYNVCHSIAREAGKACGVNNRLKSVGGFGK